MKPDERKAFDTVIGEFFAALDKPLSEEKREAFWKGLQRMSLLELSRCRDQFLADLEHGEAPRLLRISDIWAIKFKMRASAPAPRKEDPWKGDGWDVLANLRLFAYIRAQAAKGIHYCGVADRTLTTHHGQGWRPSLEAQELIAPLVAYKNAWALDCRECTDYVDSQTGEVRYPPAAVQARWWRECIERAEAEVAQVRARYAARAAA